MRKTFKDKCFDFYFKTRERVTLSKRTFKTDTEHYINGPKPSLDSFFAL